MLTSNGISNPLIYTLKIEDIPSRVNSIKVKAYIADDYETKYTDPVIYNVSINDNKVTLVRAE